MTQRVRVQCAVNRHRGRSRAVAAVLLSGVMLAVAACSHAARQVDAALLGSVDALAAEALEAGPLAGVSVAVVRDGETVVSKGYGLADIGRGVRSTPETIYPIGSLTKQFTAAAILQLVEAGRLSLDDDLGELLPNFPTQGHHVTVRHLLNHTSGIANHTDLAGGRGEPGTTRQAVVDLIAAHRFDFAPGERFSYSNSGFLLLGLVIEKVTGSTYASYLDEHVFERAGLRHTSYCPDKPGPGQARGYDIANGALVDAQPIEMAVPFAAGGLCSTVGDLLAWSQALRSGRVVSDGSYRLMTTPTEMADGTTELYGFGLVLHPLQGHAAVFHDGAINGFMSRLTFFPDDQVTVVLLANTFSEGPALDQFAAPLDALALGLQEDVELDATTRGQVIDAVLSRIRAQYVFPDRAEEMERAIRARQAGSDYDRVTNASALARLLTTHLREVSHDKHLGVDYLGDAAAGGPVGRPSGRPEGNPADPTIFGFERVERLPGNLAYIKLVGFLEPQGAEAAVAAALTSVHDAEALIFDLRDNGGGSPDMVALISSYLFDEEPVHLSDIYWRDADRTEQFWTLGDVAGTRFGPDKDVYVLTSAWTFSAAEEFAYNLQAFGRATIVGETTGGGAHPGGCAPLVAGFGMCVPTGRSINPITGTNWEGTGVVPDVAVAAGAALETAESLARQALDDAPLPGLDGESVGASSGTAS